MDGQFRSKHAKNDRNDTAESLLALFGNDLADFVKSNVAEVSQMLEDRLGRRLPLERYVGFR